MVSSGIQTARRQALKMHQLPPKSVQRPPVSVQTATREEGVVATQAPKQLKRQGLTTQRLEPITVQSSQRQGLTTQLLEPININPTKTRGVISDNQIRGSLGSADQPFNAPVPTPNILDKDAIMMRNEEQDRRDVARALVQMREKRIEGTIEDIGQGTPRADKEEEKEERPASPEVLFSDVTEDESDEELAVKQLIAEEVAMNQGRPGFVEDRIAERERRDIDDEPPRRRVGRPTMEEDIERVMREDIAERRQYLEERGEDTSGVSDDAIFNMPDDAFNFSDNRTAAGASFV
jgi:hypothetical protein